MFPRLILAGLSVLVTYAIAEGVLTFLWMRGTLEPQSVWMHERTDPAGNVVFDAIRGSRLSAEPSRIVCIATNGLIETQGLYRGNNQGFPDRDDFGPERDDPEARRYAVFGDSFTHAQFIEMNWPDRLEDLAKERGEPLQLLNFSLDGAGLANWTSVLTKHVVPQDYQLDGVIFAVWGSDLMRTFTWWDDSPRESAADPEPILLGKARRFRLEFAPASSASAIGKPHELWWAVPRERFDQALAGGYLQQGGGTTIVMTTRPLDAPEGFEAWPGEGEIV